MNHAHHVFDIRETPDTVFASITTAGGLSSWWTTSVQAGTAERGSLFLFRSRGPFDPQLRMTEIESPSLVAREGVSGHDAWATTTLPVQPDRIEGGTMVSFRHRTGADRSDDAVASASFDWRHHLDSLRILCETGRGKPCRSGTPAARVGATTPG